MMDRDAFRLRAALQAAGLVGAVVMTVPAVVLSLHLRSAGHELGLMASLFVGIGFPVAGYALGVLLWAWREVRG